jgi:hypothetical protein
MKKHHVLKSVHPSPLSAHRVRQLNVNQLTLRCSQVGDLYTCCRLPVCCLALALSCHPALVQQPGPPAVLADLLVRLAVHRLGLEASSLWIVHATVCYAVDPHDTTVLGGGGGASGLKLLRVHAL